MNEPHAKRGWLKNGNLPGNPHSSPRCHAKTRKNSKCKSPAMKNGRCRMHGGKSTGPRSKEGLERSKKANWKHGFYSKESYHESQLVNLLLKQFLMEVKRARRLG